MAQACLCLLMPSDRFTVNSVTVLMSMDIGHRLSKLCTACRTASIFILHFLGIVLHGKRYRHCTLWQIQAVWLPIS